MNITRVILVILDGVGAGAAPDAAEYGDEGAATLTHAASHVGGVRLPNLQRLGLGNAVAMTGIAKMTVTLGAWGKLQPRSPGKDTITGSWELAGLEIRQPFATFPDGFPPEIIAALEHETGRGVLGNRAAPRAEMLDQFGEEHLKTGQWIVYTSGDSELQLAAHQEVMGAEELYAGCRAARRIADGYRIGRVIARPFKGPRQGRFSETGRRRDFSMAPPKDTVLDKLSSRGVPVAGVGRVDEIFDGRGLTERIPAQGNTDAMIKMIETMAKLERGLVITHLDDFDTLGHARDAAGFARGLEEFDVQLAMLLSRSLDDDLVLLTADHGNDPTRPGNGHSRELVPILAAGPPSAAGVDLGIRRSFADVGATIAEVFGVEPTKAGESFLQDLS